MRNTARISSAKFSQSEYGQDFYEMWWNISSFIIWSMLISYINWFMWERERERKKSHFIGGQLRKSRDNKRQQSSTLTRTPTSSPVLSFVTQLSLVQYKPCLLFVSRQVGLFLGKKKKKSLSDHLSWILFFWMMNQSVLRIKASRHPVKGAIGAGEYELTGVGDSSLCLTDHWHTLLFCPLICWDTEMMKLFK